MNLVGFRVYRKSTLLPSSGQSLPNPAGPSKENMTTIPGFLYIVKNDRLPKRIRCLHTTGLACIRFFDHAGYVFRKQTSTAAPVSEATLAPGRCDSESIGQVYS